MKFIRHMMSVSPTTIEGGLNVKPKHTHKKGAIVSDGWKEKDVGGGKERRRRKKSKFSIPFGAAFMFEERMFQLLSRQARRDIAIQLTFIISFEQQKKRQRRENKV